MFKSFVVLLCLCCLYAASYGQNQRVVDSLTKVVETTPIGERFGPLYELAFEYIHKDNKKALDFISLAEQEALLAADSLSIVKSKRVKGQLLAFLERSEEAHRVLLEVLSIAERNDFQQEVLFIQLTRAKLFLFQAKYDSSLKLDFKALGLATKLADDEIKVDVLNSIGIAYYKMKNYRKGLDYFQKALASNKRSSKLSFYFYTNIGLCYSYLRDFSKARAFVEKSLEHCGLECPGKYKIGIEYALGLISSGEKQSALAEKHFLKSYALAKASNDTRFQFDNVYLLSQIYIEQELFDKAEFYLTEVENLIKPSTPFNLEKIKIYSEFSQLYRTTGNYERASYYQYKYIQLKDSIYNEELTNSLMRTEAEFVERENKAKIAAQQEVIALKEEVIHRKTIVNILAASIGIILLIFLITVLKGYRDKRNMNILLDHKVEERTRELQIIRNELLDALEEREAKIGQTLNHLTEMVNSIKGLCYLGMKDVSEPVALSYMQKIDKMTRRLDN